MEIARRYGVSQGALDHKEMVWPGTDFGLGKAMDGTGKHKESGLLTLSMGPDTHTKDSGS